MSQVEEITPIPREILYLIPIYGGDKGQLNLFIRKCEYVISRYRGSTAQDLYVFQSVTSRLNDKAAALLSEREDVDTWTQLKELLKQHFGDPRSEQCINIELESMKIKHGESYLEFCNRIQSIRSLLISKVNMLGDADLKRAKTTIYNNTSLNVFLYNLPEDMVRVVRLKCPATLENALSVVLEEVNFHDQYNMRKRIHGISSNNSTPMQRQLLPQNSSVGFKFGTNPQPSGFRFQTPLSNNNMTPKFNFGNQPAPFRMPQGQSPNFGYRPQLLGYRPPQFGSNPPQFGYRPQLGYRPQFGNNQPQPSGFRPTPNVGMTPQQFGYKPPQVQAPRFQDSDVTMRTALAVPREGFKLNELTGYDEEQYENYCDNEFDYDMSGQYGYTEDVEHEVYNNETPYEISQVDAPQEQTAENFPALASIRDKKS